MTTLSVGPPEASSAQRSVCFVLCVESGPLEAQTVRAVASLRRFGGALAASHVVAVIPRLGPPLSRSTRRELAELGVDVCRAPGRRRYAWFHFLNKAVAVATAERRTDADVVAFVDSDALFAGEPADLRLDDATDFAACVPDTGLAGTRGPADPNEPFWAQLCDVLGLRLDDLPWVEPTVGEGPIRMYFNGGVFAYRRSTGYGARYRDQIVRALDARTSFPAREGDIEQMCVGLAAVEAGLRCRHLPSSDNFTLIAGRTVEGFERSVPLGGARILHYHDSLAGPHFAATLETLGEAFPDLTAWLREHGPLQDPAARGNHFVRECLRVMRGMPRRLHRRRIRRAQLSSGHRTGEAVV